MFVDHVKIYVKAGDGGDGSVSFRREKYVPEGGPDGGDGGRGGDVIIEASHHFSTLIELRYQQQYIVKRGSHGAKKKSSGRRSDDRVIGVPLGTVIYDSDTDAFLGDLKKTGQRLIVAEGGHGGRGNWRFRSPTDQTPMEAEPGQPGEAFWLRLELKLIAEVGLLGLPNAGKSSLIAAISKAHPKIGSYPFTTLEPNLGVAHWFDAKGQSHSLTIADVPGIIEGAHEGKGLGIQFLKHLERTSMLLHLVDVSEMAEDPVESFEVIREEVQQYSSAMGKKPFLVAGTKIDIAGDGENQKALRQHCKEQGFDYFSLSSATGAGTQDLLRVMVLAAEAKRAADQDQLSDELEPDEDPCGSPPSDGLLDQH